jgi:hypothetical protein
MLFIQMHHLINELRPHQVGNIDWSTFSLTN